MVRKQFFQLLFQLLRNVNRGLAVATALLITLAFAVTPALAAEGDKPAKADGGSLGLLIIIIGVVALLFVGLAYLNTSSTAAGTVGADDDDE